MPFLDQLGAQLLCVGHPVGPEITLGDQRRRGVQGEVLRRNPIQFVPGQRERHGHLRANARAVRGHDSRSAGPGRIDEHFACAVFPHEGGRGECGVKALRTHRDRARRRGCVGCRLPLDGNEHVQALRSAGLDRTHQAGVGQGLANQLCGADGQRERLC